MLLPKSFKLRQRRNALTVALLSAMIASLIGCNDSKTKDDENVKNENVKDDAYYRAMAESMVAKMTVEEKMGMLVGPGYVFSNGTFVPNQEAFNNLKSDVLGTAGYINGVYNEAAGLDIAVSKLADGAAGVRIEPRREGDSATYYGTAFPVGSSLASTWNPELVKQVAAAIANEVKEYGLDMWLAPGMNIQRNPLNGRNFEYFSEDPLLSGLIAAAEVTGAQSQGVGTTIKHFIANNGETSRSTVDNVIAPRALREIYLRGFQYAEEYGKPWAIMTAMNKVNGVYTGQSHDLNTSILRDEWGFSGFVMSDWWSGNGSYAEMIKSGNDLIEPGGPAIPYGYGDALTGLQEAYKAGDLSEDTITQGATRILTQVLKLPANNGFKPGNAPDLTAHASLSKQAAIEGMVLLKNDAASLPLTASTNIAAFGITQVNTIKGGSGSGDVNALHTVTIIEGLGKKFNIDQQLKAKYETFFNENKSETNITGLSAAVVCPEMPLSLDDITLNAENNDAAVISIGRNSSQGLDLKNTAGEFMLSEEEKTLIDNVSSAFHKVGKKVVVVLNIATVIETQSWKDKVDAIVLAYLPGQEAGDAITDILVGGTSPAGKLAQSFPLDYTDVPSSSGFPGTDTNGDGVIDTHYYNEGIYVGYRYYATFGKEVSYPFGYGLSYTTFEFKDSAVSSNNINKEGAKGSVNLTATVLNSGNTAGKEVAQVYISAPDGELAKPTIELKGFAKTQTLTAGGTEKLKFEIPAKWLASFDPSHNQWIIEPGTYKAYIAPSSDVTDVPPVSFNINSKIVVSETTPGVLPLPAGVTEASFETQY